MLTAPSFLGEQRHWKPTTLQDEAIWLVYCSRWVREGGCGVGRTEKQDIWLHVKFSESDSVALSGWAVCLLQLNGEVAPDNTALYSDTGPLATGLSQFAVLLQARHNTLNSYCASTWLERRVKNNQKVEVGENIKTIHSLSIEDVSRACSRMSVHLLKDGFNTLMLIVLSCTQRSCLNAQSSNKEQIPTMMWWKVISCF